MMAAVFAASVELFLQPIKLKARTAEALIRPKVRTSERFLMFVLTPAGRKSFYWRPRIVG